MLASLESFYQVIYEGIGLPMGEWIFGNSSIRSFFWGFLDQILSLFRQTPTNYFQENFGSLQTSVDWLASVITFLLCVTMILVVFVFMYKTFKRLLTLAVS